MPSDFGEFYKSSFSKIYNFIYRRVGDLPTAEDITSETFFRVYKAWDCGIKNPNAYAFKVATNSLNSYYRSKYKLKLEYIDDSDEIEDPRDFVSALIKESDHQVVRAFISHLKEKESLALSLRYLEEYSNNEISEIMEITESDVRVTIHRGLKELKLLLKKHEESRRAS